MKKKRTYGKTLTILATASFVIASIEGYIFYENYAQFGLFRILLTLQNSFKAFLFSPSLSAEKILGTLSAETPPFEFYIGLAYVVAAFVAPLCTATALFVAVERFFRSQLGAWRIRRQEGLLVFGYNEDVKMLLKNRCSGKDGEKPPIVHLVADVEIPEKEELDLMKQNIFFRRMNCVYASEASMLELFSEIHAEKIKKIFLLEESSMQNVSLYLRLCELTKQTDTQADRKFPFGEGAVCCCRCTESYARELIGDYFDVEKPRLGLYLFNLAELRVRKSFERHGLWENEFRPAPPPDPSLPAERFHVHVLIAGFGHVGEQFLRQTINMGVAHSASTILIDVVDQNMAQKKERFFSSLSLDAAFVHENELCIGSDPSHAGGELADGLLRIRFHHMDARGNQFTGFLRRAAEELPFTYAAVCIKDLDVGIHCVSAIERCTSDNPPFPIAVKLEGSEQLAGYLDKNDKTFGNVFAMGGVTAKTALSFRDIYNSETEDTARAYHEIYRKIHFSPAGTQVREGAAWESLKLYQQQANRLLSYHSDTKEYVLRTMGTKPAREVLRERLASVGITVADNSFTYTMSETELLKRMEEDPILSELMRMEHRRWCYAMLFDGWSGNCIRKNETRKQSPYICPWDKLDESVRKYDLIPALMMGK